MYSNLSVPEGRMVVLVIVVHGVGEHSGCYCGLAEKMVSQSVGVLAYDQRGHGRLPGIRGHASVSSLKNDLHCIVAGMKKDFPDVPIVVLGHSMGGQIVLSYAFDAGSAVRGVIALSPWLRLTRQPPQVVVKFAKIAAYITPWLTISTGVKAEQLTETGDNTVSSKKDPLLHKKISIKLFSDLFENGEKLMQDNHNPEMPVLLMHGTADTLISYQAAKLFAKKNEKYVEFKEWHDMRHNLLKDTCSEVVVSYIISWITKNIT